MTGVLTPVPAALLPVVQTPAALRERLRGVSSVGLVPTMGSLHAGHATLIEQARRENDAVVVSVFVNPLQFGQNEDFAAYPRDLEHDRALALSAGADLIFHPEAATMYPAGFSSGVTVGGVSEALEGASRPGHFGGVATVVMKLLNLVGADGRPADHAYFGEKDWQQLAVVRRMVRDLDHKTQVIGVPTVRAASGLALSSRNRYLSAEQQATAAVLSRALRAVQTRYADGERRVPALLQAGQEVLAGTPELKLDYLSLVDEHLRPLTELPPVATPGVSISRQPGEGAGPHTESMYRVLIAANIFGVRLIDNMPLVAAPSAETGRPGA